MIVRKLLRRMTHRPLAGPLLMAVLVVTACDPQEIKEIVGHNGHSNGPSGGGSTGTGNTGGGTGVPSDPCAATTCLAGTHCEAQPVKCIKAPCPPIAVCVKNETTTSCGGFTGKPCPGAGKCIDDPSDSCDPTKGGADCGGVCTCVQNVVCVMGAKFDSSPGVCACVLPSPPPACPPVCDIFCPNGHVLDANGCATCACKPAPDDPCATIRCAAGTHCEASAVMCSKPPCNAGAACVPDAPKIFCGGIAGIACPGSGTCVDDPTDCCDPKAGGADCGGVCQCVQTALCVKGAVFDSSPKVCACVGATPPPPMCGPVCQIFCQYGNVLDANGCKTCACNPPPSPPTLCPVEKCPGSGPKSATVMCPDGSTAGPACVLSAFGSCEWTVTVCLAKDV